MESILNSIKQLLGIASDDTSFDNELIIHINSAIAVLTQLNVGPSTGFHITGDSEEWNALIGTREDIDNIKSAIYYRVRLSFDSPQNSFLVDSLKKQSDEVEWRINVAVDPSP